MKLKISFLFAAVMLVALSVQAQSVRNPLNMEPANIRLYKGVSPKSLSVLTFYRPDGTPFDRTNFVYGENGRKIAEQNQRWSARDGVWADVSGTGYSYGEKMMAVVPDAAALNSRENPPKTEYYCNDKGKRIYSLGYKWNRDAENWAENAVIKGFWTYDENNRVAEYAKMYYNEITGTWDIPVTRILYSYDEKGKQSEEIIQSWNNDGGSWKNAGKYAYTYSESAEEAVCLSYAAHGGDWVYDGKIVCSYDKDGDIARCEYYDRDADSGISAYCVYAYSEAARAADALTDGDIAVSPNPAVYDFELTVPEELVGKTAILYDFSGRQKKSVRVAGPRLKVDVSDLSKGIYVMKIDSYSKKIIINR
ncbi:MAG: T9SS type A sorting domain-containing protein [Tannerella sp.]|jgi:hypothetical protein|nr:T9SS type A sorting domain-containing protein [Tannerella sp.]